MDNEPIRNMGQELRWWEQQGFLRVVSEDEGPFGMRYVVVFKGWGEESHITEDDLRWYIKGLGDGLHEGILRARDAFLADLTNKAEMPSGKAAA